MNYYFIKTLQLIKCHGAFSYPMINFVLKNKRLSNGEKILLTAIKLKSFGEYKDTLDEIKKGLKCCMDKNIKYFLKAEELDILRILGRDKTAEHLYQDLRKRFSEISPSIRGFVIVEILSHQSFFYKDMSFGRIKANGTVLNDAAKVFLEISIGRNMIKNDDFKGIEHLKKALDLALGILHPTGIIEASNLISWYGLNYDIDESLEYGQKALYWSGWFYEIPRFHVFDTLFVVMDKVKSQGLAELSKDLVLLYESISEEQQDHYKQTLKQARNLLGLSRYDIDGTITRFLRRLMKNNGTNLNISRMQIYNILNRKVKQIRGATIRKIIKYIGIKNFKIDSLPLPFVIEIAKMKNGLEDGIDSIIEGNLSLDPYVEARRDLEIEFLRRMPDHVKEKFIKAYLELGKDEKSVIDRFARDYIRYDIRWEMRVDVPDSMKEHTQAFHFKETPAALAYWALDNQKEREKLLEVLEKFE